MYIKSHFKYERPPARRRTAKLINLESVLIEHAHLEKECVFLGASNHVELWDKNTWNKYKQDNKDDYSFMAEEVEF